MLFRFSAFRIWLRMRLGVIFGGRIYEPDGRGAADEFALRVEDADALFDAVDEDGAEGSVFEFECFKKLRGITSDIPVFPTARNATHKLRLCLLSLQSLHLRLELLQPRFLLLHRFLPALPKVLLCAAVLFCTTSGSGKGRRLQENGLGKKRDEPFVLVLLSSGV